MNVLNFCVLSKIRELMSCITGLVEEFETVCVKALRSDETVLLGHKLAKHGSKLFEVSFCRVCGMKFEFHNFGADVCIQYQNVNWRVVGVAFLRKLGFTFDPQAQTVSISDYVEEHVTLTNCNLILMKFLDDTLIYFDNKLSKYDVEPIHVCSPMPGFAVITSPIWAIFWTTFQYLDGTILLPQEGPPL